MSFPERDWQTLSRFKPVALERLCRRILDEVQHLVADAAEGESHRTYLALYRHLKERDRLVAECFDDWRRSQALTLLTLWYQHNLLTDEEFAAFSPETRAAVEAWQQLG
ncbi:MAG: peptide ABC transporter substrate-binding protein [Anaerolineae bacterium]|nr:peptide ABC transporter substrate-binding protein [Anaerolineae bacterium]